MLKIENTNFFFFFLTRMLIGTQAPTIDTIKLSMLKQVLAIYTGGATVWNFIFHS